MISPTVGAFKAIKAVSCGIGPTRKFVRGHRAEIDACIKLHCGRSRGLTNDGFRYLYIRKVTPTGRCHNQCACNSICLKGRQT